MFTTAPLVATRNAAAWLLAFALAACATQEEPPAESQQAATASRRQIVILDADALSPAMEKAITKAGGTLVRPMSGIGVAIVTGDKDFAARARKIAGVKAVVPDLHVKLLPDEAHRAFEGRALTGKPSSAGADIDPATREVIVHDLAYPTQWGLTAVKAKRAWDHGNFGQGVRVAVIDTGVVAEHPDIAPNLNRPLSRSFVAGESVFVSAWAPFNAFHGGHVAGIIGAALGGGYVVGVAPRVELVAVKVLNDEGWGYYSDWWAGMMYAGDIGADVANMSLGGHLPRAGVCDAENGCITADEVASLMVAFGRAARYATAKGVTLIASAGNDAVDFDHPTQVSADWIVVPAMVPGVIAVAATAPVGWAVDPEHTDLDRPASYTNYGQTLVDLAAPGGDFAYPDPYRWCWVVIGRQCGIFDGVLSAFGAYDYIWAAGTSMAAPHVSGVAALLIRAHGKKMSPQQVAVALRSWADDVGKRGSDPYSGAGRAAAPDTCVAATCADLSACDGVLDDGCGGRITCGGCASGSLCLDHQCCTPQTCAGAGRACGTMWDGCSQTIDCGTCDEGSTCQPWGSCCKPLTCAGAGRTCGTMWDGCGQYVDCGTCDDGQTCLWSGSCCTPQTCQDEGRTCGWMFDGCQGWSYCGDCGAGQACNGSGTCEQLPDVQLDCHCWDGAEIDLCEPVTCWDWSTQWSTCSAACEHAGGGWPSCTDTPECHASFHPAFGAQLEHCSCAAGATFDFCAAHGCDDAGALAADCDLACAGEGGAGASSCEPAAPACTGAVPPPAGDSPIDCHCSDGTEIQLCTGVTCDDGPDARDVCNRACALHGGGPWVSCPLPAPTCEPRYVPARFGPNQLRCGCADGAELDACDVADCASPAEVASGCAAACNGHLGATSTACEALAAACTGAAPPPPGDDLDMCGCADGTRIEVCTELDCGSGQAMESVCQPLCVLHGGLSSIGCFPDQASCEPGYHPPFGPDLTSCVCQDAATFELCTQTGCDSTAAVDDVCAGACRMHAGAAAAACAPRADRCTGALPPPPGASQVMCGCSDGTEIDFCADAGCDDFHHVEAICEPACALHDGYVSSGCWVPETCVAKYEPAFGPDALSCTCSDGTKVAACTQTDCASSDAVETACSGACIAHGGAGATACTANQATCTGEIPPPVGPNRADCWCADGTPVHICTTLDCTSSPDQVAVCNPMCALHGGLSGLGGCYPDSTCP